MTGDRKQSELRTVVCPLKQANAFVSKLHRHHPPVPGHKYSIAVTDAENRVRGVAIVGRPVARGNDDGLTCEVLRVATDGCDNACSALYGAVRRAAKELGYWRIFTYTLASEPGTSLRASGWQQDGTVKGRSWSCPSRPRDDDHPLEDKIRWVCYLREKPAPIFDTGVAL